MKTLIRKLIVMTVLMTAPEAFTKENIQTSDLARVFERPLIMGASISADWSTSSPSKRLSLRYTKPENIQLHAFGGRPGREVLATLPKSAFEKRTIVLAMDLLFWDSATGDPTVSIKALDRLMTAVEAKNIPIVLGEIPELIAGYQPYRAKLNQAIHKTCEKYSKCHVMPFISVHQKLMRDRFLEVGGKRYTFSELVPDGLHLATTASEYLADMMRDVITGKKI